MHAVNLVTYSKHQMVSFTRDNKFLVNLTELGQNRPLTPVSLELARTHQYLILNSIN